MHEEPIVCSPEDALRSFLQGNLEFLALEDWLVVHPAGGGRLVGMEERAGVAQ
jgi:hypothetical protein